MKTEIEKELKKSRKFPPAYIASRRWVAVVLVLIGILIGVALLSRIASGNAALAKFEGYYIAGKITGPMAAQIYFERARKETNIMLEIVLVYLASIGIPLLLWFGLKKITASAPRVRGFSWGGNAPPGNGKL